ncbi:hypothetical protein [Nodularia spumigena]|uniref:hypothetical protein n=1 Tax=Nodularia spumigena TaxID=70799 RepID=UPI00232C9BA4|nr:hypothetical protein [Nodularia spumigena]MDB9399176.1 hypothetical protein [Microcystis aeruginosa CS-567/02-A1]MDB9534205.1 hypothetical protein [Nodularia spumigena CS-1038]MDB9322000.1 hypothetical protein [Nodularia spumigena CS-591/07A]MDB9338550.1 hypothetical protein [Nodularia spumigena CS-589/07]MDB9500746.1 hypothetical protein [Nodularia spumigena CS-336/02]
MTHYPPGITAALRITTRQVGFPSLLRNADAKNPTDIHWFWRKLLSISLLETGT